MLRVSRFPSCPVKDPFLIDSWGRPRFWATVWALFLPADLAESTLRGKLSHIENLYKHADETIGAGQLDDALATCNLDVLSTTLETYFMQLRNRPVISTASEDRWQAALHFVLDTVQRVARSDKACELNGRVARLELLHAKLRIGRRRRPEQIRSLPSEVVEYLYELLDPESKVNPFKVAETRWRIYILYILMLHQGLRRSETLVLPIDAIKVGFDRNLNQDRFWMAVRYNAYEDDLRATRPSIKTALSIRQIPVSQLIALAVQEYISNYRGRVNHSFLISSQHRKPLSIEGVTKTFQKISASLPKSLRKVLLDHTGEAQIRPHDLRHTCAVVRLNQFLSEGISMEDALQRLRSFFGWTKDSVMPLRYARAVFEDRLAAVWNSKFDARVEVLKNLPKRSR